MLKSPFRVENIHIPAGCVFFPLSHNVKCNTYISLAFEGEKIVSAAIELMDANQMNHDNI